MKSIFLKNNLDALTSIVFSKKGERLMGMKKFSILFLMVAMMLVIAACSSNDSGGNSTTPNEMENESGGEEKSVNISEKEPVNEQVTLKVFGYSFYKVNYDFFKPYVEKQFPHITLDWIDAKDEKEVITSGQLPDIQISGFGLTSRWLDAGIPSDLNDLIKKYQFDLEVFDPKVLQAVQMFGDHGELYGLPFKTNYYMLVYNKDIFDEYAQPYPTEKMSWDEVLELAKNVHREKDGVQIRGIVVYPAPGFVARGLSPLNPIDPETEKAVLNTDEWVQVFELLYDIFSLPNNNNMGNAWNTKQFLKGTVAMYAGFGGFSGFENAPFDWDVTTYPHFASSPEGNMAVATDVLYLWKTSEHKDEAVQVMYYIAANEEIQTEFAKEGTAPAIMLDNVGEIFGQNNPVLEGKNVKAIFASEFRENHKPSKYASAVTTLRQNFEKYLNGEIDVRTALSKTEEEANLKIDEMKMAED